MYYFCTYFDEHYLARGLALYHSLREHCPAFKLWVLCMDHATYHLLEKLNLPGLHPIALETFERDDEHLQSAKQNRSRIEYYFTCTPSLPLYVLNNWPEVDLITYLDADLFFFDDPGAIYDEIADHSIAIIGHRFPPDLRHLEQWGIYNVGWLSFRRDDYAFACLHWWRERCIEWCYDRLENGRFADQKYLDIWPTSFQGVVVLRHKGANLAPWNLANYKIQRRKNRIWVDEQSLIFFHFHGFKQIKGWLYVPNLMTYKMKLSKVVLRSIYAPYIRMLLATIRQISSLLPITHLPSGMRDQLAEPQFSHRYAPLPRRAVSKLRGLLHMGGGVLTRKYILAIGGRVI